MCLPCQMAKVCSFLNSNKNLANKSNIPPATPKRIRIHFCSVKCLCNIHYWRNGGENVWKATSLEGKSDFSTALCWTLVLVTFSMTMLHFKMCVFPLYLYPFMAYKRRDWHNLMQWLSALYGNWHLLIQKNKNIAGCWQRWSKKEKKQIHITTHSK